MKLNKKELQNIADNIKDYICKTYNLEDIKVRVKDIRRGRARSRTRYISIPKWSYESENFYYFVHYILHELAHFIQMDLLGKSGHDKTFKDIEQKLLDRFGMKAEYNRAYIKELWDLKENNCLWVEKKNLYELVNK